MTDALKVSHNDQDWNPKYFGIVCGLFCALYMISNPINSKMIDVWGFALPGGILVFPLCCIVTDLMTEIYGFNRTRQAIWTVLACTVLQAFIFTLVIYLPPAGFWQNQQAFETIFSTSWRIATAGCLAWMVGEFSNSYIMAKMKIFQNAKNMSGRFIGSTLVGQFFDTGVFFLIAFAGTMPVMDLIKMMLIAWTAKVLYEVVALPLSVNVTKWLKHREGIEHFDDQKLSII